MTVRAAYLAPYRSRGDRRAIADFVADIPTTPDHPSYARPRRGRCASARRSTCPCCSPGASATRSSTSSSPPISVAGCRRPSCTASRSPVTSSSRRRTSLRSRTRGSSDSGRLRRAPWCRPRSTPEAPWAALVAREDDETTAVAVGGGATLSFASLARRVARSRRRACGVPASPPGDRVAVLAPEPPDFIAAAYACWAIGAVTVVVDRGLGVRGLARALRSAEPRWLLGTPQDARRRAGAPLGAGRGPARDRLAQRRRREAVGRRRRPCSRSRCDGGRRLHLGRDRPREGSRLHQRQMAAQFDAVRACYAIGPDDRLVAAFAPFALYGPALGIPGRRPRLRHHRACVAARRGARRRMRRDRRDDPLRRTGRPRRRAGVAGGALARGPRGARRAPARALRGRAGVRSAFSRRSRRLDSRAPSCTRRTG